MKKGDIVKINDGSYSIAVENGDLHHVFGVELQKEKYKVLDMGLRLPTATYGMSGISHNDTLVVGCDSGRLVFIQARLCQPNKPAYCQYCGHALESCKNDC